jgi:hypothetical protein
LLTRKEFYDHLVKKGCSVGTFEGLNRTSNQIEIINEKTGKYFFIATPIDDKYVQSFVVERACLMLGVEPPTKY